ncbi:MAG TPA: type II toxin-antitoxin system VapC family toxin [Chloroflexia bacterium]|nr:type II toxin-antitoxin system VapC family toxin [Chloroflexia bacterium]
MKYLLDTNVISELVARRPSQPVLQWIDALDADSLYLSVITIGELRKGIEKLPNSPRKNALSAWLADDLLVRFGGRVLSVDVDVMLTWGELTGRMERSGRRLPAIDSLIAALAIHHNCSLVTRNEDDFKDTGVTVLNPWK